MEKENGKLWKNKGGRPKKDVKYDQQLALMCTVDERRIIEGRAMEANSSVSEYLRELATKGHSVRKNKSLPKEVLQLTATFNHMAANLNQIAKQRNRFEVLTTPEIAILNLLCKELVRLNRDIKNYLS